MRALAVVLIACALASCAIEPPKPWEKGNLAKPGCSSITTVSTPRRSKHIYTSKEGASGGYGVGGGGCGCN